MAAPKTKTYNVMAKLELEVGFDVDAVSMTEAIAKAEAMKMGDIIDFDDQSLDFNDGKDPKIMGVYEKTW